MMVNRIALKKKKMNNKLFRKVKHYNPNLSWTCPGHTEKCLYKFASINVAVPYQVLESSAIYQVQICWELKLRLRITRYLELSLRLFLSNYNCYKRNKCKDYLLSKPPSPGKLLDLAWQIWNADLFVCLSVCFNSVVTKHSYIMRVTNNFLSW